MALCGESQLRPVVSSGSKLSNRSNFGLIWRQRTTWKYDGKFAFVAGLYFSFNRSFGLSPVAVFRVGSDTGLLAGKSNEKRCLFGVLISYLFAEKFNVEIRGASVRCFLLALNEMRYSIGLKQFFDTMLWYTLVCVCYGYFRYNYWYTIAFFIIHRRKFFYNSIRVDFVMLE